MRREWMIPLREIVRTGSELDEQELMRRYYERLLDWSESGVIKINRDGKLLGPLIVPDQAELRKRICSIPWARPKR